VRALTRCWLENTQGLVEVEEGEKLAELASQVTANHAIVEVGSHTGPVVLFAYLVKGGSPQLISDAIFQALGS